MARTLLHFLPIFAFFYLAAASGCPSTNGELYWKTVFPESSMPKNLQVLLKPADYNMATKDLDSDSLLPNSFKYSKNANKIKYSVSDELISFSYASKSYKIVSFFEQDLRPGKQMKIPQLLKTTKESSTFLPCETSNSIPFSTAKFPEILNQFSVQPKSKEAMVMKQTIKDCEADAIKGENKFCAISLESLIDTTTSILGKDINLVTSEVDLEKTKLTPFFTIGSEGVKNLGEKQVICHKPTYPFAVFLCHTIRKTDVYSVPLVGSNGIKAKGLAICHKDTRGWNPQYPAFQQLHVKPGTVPICHFLSADAIVWIPK